MSNPNSSKELVRHASKLGDSKTALCGQVCVGEGQHRLTQPKLVKSCPFCGGAPQLQHGHGDITYVLCDGCGAITSFRPNLKGSRAIAAYNRRHTLETKPSGECE